MGIYDDLEQSFYNNQKATMFDFFEIIIKAIDELQSDATKQTGST